LFVLLAIPGFAQWAFAAEPEAPAVGQLVVDPDWPKKPHEAWKAVPGIAVDAQDRVYVFTRTKPALQVYQSDGTSLGSWPVESEGGAHYVRIASDGNLWLTDVHQHVVEKYSPEGKRLMRLGQWGQAGNDREHFDRPTDVAVLPSGEFFVTDGYGNRRVVHFDALGRFVKQWGEEGTEPGQFALPHSIVADAQKRLYVADRNNGRIQVFDTEGKLLTVWDHGIMPWGLYITGGDTIWVCGSSRVRTADGTGWQVLPPSGQLVLKLNPEGKVLLRADLVQISTPPGNPGEVNWLHAIAIDSHGAFYLGDIDGKRVQKYSLRQP
jgi:hypothetical protein